MPHPGRITDADELSAVFEDHAEHIYLGPWTELTIGNLKLVRQDDGTITIEPLPECVEL
jgi:hypothetical protein